MWSGVRAFACVCVGLLGCAPKQALEQGSSEQAVTSATGLVISQVYGGTGGSGALFNRDYVELFNRSSQPASLAGLQLHYAGSSGDFVLAASLPDATVPPGGHYLVGFAAGERGQDLRVDAAGLPAVNLLPAHGKVALARNVAGDDAGAQALGCGASRCKSGRVVDLVGYGVATDHEGAGPASAPAMDTAIVRKDAGCMDTGENAADFEVAAPAPRTSRSPVQPCPGEGTR